MPSIALESPSVVQFFNMFEQTKKTIKINNAKKSSSSASTNNTPNRSTTKNNNHRKNSKPSRASSVSPKPNRHNKQLPNTPKNKKQHQSSVCQEHQAKGVGLFSSTNPNGRTPQRTHGGNNNSRRNTGEFKNLQKVDKTSKIYNNCPKNNNNNNQNENQSDSSLSVKSSKPSNNINGYVKLAKLTNKSDSDNDSRENGNSSSHGSRSSQRMRYRNEDSFCFEVQANSEHYAGSAEAPDAKSLPLPPTDWIVKNVCSNRVPKNDLFTANSKNNNNSNSKPDQDLTPNVQHLFASMGMVKASA